MPLSDLAPETTAEIRTLHSFVAEHQWKEYRQYCGRGCHCYEGTTYECPNCGNKEEQGHKPSCSLGTALLNIGTFLDMQEESYAQPA